MDHEKSSSSSAARATAEAPLSHPLLPGVDAGSVHTECPSTTSTKVPTAASMSAVNDKRNPKKLLGTPYQSVDEKGRVWGVPNMGGRGQCFDCCKPAMPNSRRCQACLRALAEAVHGRMSTEHLAELQ